MDICIECGSHDVEVRQRDGVVVYECGLCGALAGDAAAVAMAETAREAREHGVEPLVWPLVRVLRRLPGFRIERSHGGDDQLRSLPFVQWQVLDARGLQQLENLAKSLQLAARALGLHWVVEVEYQHHLVFVLKPRPPQRIEVATVAASRADLEVLPAMIERDSRLSWWRHGPSREPG